MWLLGVLPLNSSPGIMWLPLTQEGLPPMPPTPLTQEGLLHVLKALQPWQNAFQLGQEAFPFLHAASPAEFPALGNQPLYKITSQVT